MLESVPKPILATLAVLILTLIIYGGIIWVNMRFFPQNVYGKKRRRVKTYRVTKPNPDLETIVIRCFDRRFSNAQRGFIRKELRLKRRDFYPVKIAGGPAALARPSQMPEEFGSLMIQIDLAVGHHAIKKIVIISHEDCRRYDKLVDRTACGPHPEKQDLPKAIQTLLERHPMISIEAFYGRFTDKNRKRIFFEKIGTTSEIKEALLQEVA